jgi:prepilin-type N-terminal cleavage/methylation domain-containing protein
MRMRRAFSIIELLITMALIGLLTRIAVPRYSEMKRRAIAASILGDVHAIRIAAYTHYTEHGAFPPDAGVGQLPTQLVENLPTGFSFDRIDYDYDWHVWTATNSSGNSETLIGITVVVTDSRLAAQLVKTAGQGLIPIVTPTQVTFLVSSSS